MPAFDGLHRKDDRAPSRWWVIGIVAVGVIAVIIGVLNTVTTGEVVDQRDAAVHDKVTLGQEVTAACARGEVVQSPEGRDLCERAAQAQNTPLPAVQPVQGERGPGPTREELRAAVDAYCAERDSCAGRPPTADEVAEAVATYMTAHPPEPGRPPTAGEIANAVATWFATNPPPQGERGEKGERGPGPTAQQISDSVAAWLADHPPPRGEPGPSCPEDASLETAQLNDGRYALVCVLDEQPGREPPETTDPPDPTTTEPPPPPETTEPTPDDGGILDGG